MERLCRSPRGDALSRRNVLFDVTAATRPAFVAATNQVVDGDFAVGYRGDDDVLPSLGAGLDDGMTSGQVHQQRLERLAAVGGDGEAVGVVAGKLECDVGAD